MAAPLSDCFRALLEATMCRMLWDPASFMPAADLWCLREEAPLGAAGWETLSEAAAAGLKLVDPLPSVREPRETPLSEPEERIVPMDAESLA